MQAKTIQMLLKVIFQSSEDVLGDYPIQSIWFTRKVLRFKIAVWWPQIIPSSMHQEDIETTRRTQILSLEKKREIWFHRQHIWPENSHKRAQTYHSPRETHKAQHHQSKYSFSKKNSKSGSIDYKNEPKTLTNELKLITVQEKHIGHNSVDSKTQSQKKREIWFHRQHIWPENFHRRAET